MINIARKPDDFVIITEAETLYEHPDGIILEKREKKALANQDASVRFEEVDGSLNVYLSAKESKPAFVVLRWNYRTEEPIRILGDSWGGANGDLTWSSLNGEKFMPWYFIGANDKQETVGCGVMVQPNSFVSFQYDSSGVCGWFDVRCGSMGVELTGRELLIGTVVCEQYSGITPFEAAIRFCKIMSSTPILPKEPVYGANNWYYAYGKSSGKEIREDAALIAALSEGNENRPFMVIDDGWQPNACAGPWVANEKFEDMGKIAETFKRKGVKPGIWVRLLKDEEAIAEHPDWRLCKEQLKPYLDPSHPEVKNYLKEVVSRVRDWGYMLMKHDYSTHDMFGNYGFELNGMFGLHKDWCFYDRTKTSAEIVLEFYRLIRESAGDMMLLGCNTISHLCAGLVEINRVGGDTSGKLWNRTRVMGVNSLAFRLPQNGNFYMVDADCVGILDDNIPWELNIQWMELLAKSGTPLFISCRKDALKGEKFARTKELFRYAASQNNVAVPLDWEYNNEPHIWDIDGEIHKFDWVMDTYPSLLKKNIQPM